VHCIVTSPPYFGLRDYGVAGQIGLEPTPEAFTAEMVGVFAELRRVLRKDGTAWLNIGDSYAGGGTIGRNDTTPEALARRAERYGAGTGAGSLVLAAGQRPRVDTLKSKDLVGIPWRVAFALQADGWYLRQDIIWSKPNPMPESVTDRCTKAHEYLFLLSRSERYYFDQNSIREEQSGGAGLRGGKAATQLTPKQTANTNRNGDGGLHKNYPPEFGRNRRSVWEVTTQPYAEAHFATFPPALIEPCILAGCPRGGTVLDPFGGAGTTGMVAAMAERRIRNDCPLFADVASA